MISNGKSVFRLFNLCLFLWADFHGGDIIMTIKGIEIEPRNL